MASEEVVPKQVDYGLDQHKDRFHCKFVLRGSFEYHDSSQLLLSLFLSFFFFFKKNHDLNHALKFLGINDAEAKSS